jgi:hypothetical protein
VFAVVSRVPGGVWTKVAGPFVQVAEAHAVAERVLRDTPPGEAIVATCPWDMTVRHDANVERARLAGAIERVT